MKNKVLNTCQALQCPRSTHACHRYGLTEEQVKEAEAELEEAASQTQRVGNASALSLVNLMGKAYLKLQN